MHAQLEVWKATCTTSSSPLMWNQETDLEVSQQNVEMSSDGKLNFDFLFFFIIQSYLKRF